jgi:hypothetical protein
MNQSPWATTLTVVSLSLMLLARVLSPGLRAVCAGTGVALLAFAVYLDRAAPWGQWLFRWGLLAGAVGVLAFLAFSTPEPVPAPVPTPPPAEPNPDPDQIVDAANGFRLARPGPDWKLLPRERMPCPPYSRDVQAGAVVPGDLLAQVLVFPPERLTSDPDSWISPASLASRHEETFGWGDMQSAGPAEWAQFQGQWAVRYHISGIDATGLRMLAQCTLFVHRGRVYILSVIGPADRHQPDDPAFAAFTNKFTLTD